MVLNETYYREDAAGKKTWYNPLEVTVSHDDKGRPTGAVLIADGQPVVLGGVEKMSKSKNNGVDPQTLIDQHGADTARLFVMFAAPPEQSLEWSGTGVEGASRFLRRVWQYAHGQADALKQHAKLDVSKLNDTERALRREIYTVLKQADFDYGRLQYNTVVSAAMKMLNAVDGAKDASAGRPQRSVRRAVARAVSGRAARHVPVVVGTRLRERVRRSARRAVAARSTKPRSNRPRSNSCCR